MDNAELSALREDLRGYHDDVKRRLDLVEDQVKEHHVAIHGIAGDDTVPGLNVEVQGLRGFRDHCRAGIAAAWAAILTIGCTLWARR